MIWKVVKHGNLSMAEGLRIAYLKDQHWPYGLESQILWMKDSIELDDAHLLGEEQDGNNMVLKAYSTLTNLRIEIDEQHIDCIGVGGVCVDKAIQHFGIGRLLMNEARKYINSQNKLGILLCKDMLVPFYEKCDWRLLHYQSASVAGNNYVHDVMLLDKEWTCSSIIIGKNF